MTNEDTCNTHAPFCFLVKHTYQSPLSQKETDGLLVAAAVLFVHETMFHTMLPDLCLFVWQSLGEHHIGVDIPAWHDPCFSFYEPLLTLVSLSVFDCQFFYLTKTHTVSNHFIGLFFPGLWSAPNSILVEQQAAFYLLLRTPSEYNLCNVLPGWHPSCNPIRKVSTAPESNQENVA
jgi:hypothetical protein